MTPHLSMLECAILASFILNPMDAYEKGRQSVQIVRCAPHAFHRIKPGYDRLLLTIIVAHACLKLKRRGYLEKAGTVRRQFTTPNLSYTAESVTLQYDAPLFRLTESGFMQALHCCDYDYLPPLRNAPSKKARKSQTPFELLYGNDSYHVSVALLTSIGATRAVHTKGLHST